MRNLNPWPDLNIAVLGTLGDICPGGYYPPGNSAGSVALFFLYLTWFQM